MKKTTLTLTLFLALSNLVAQTHQHINTVPSKPNYCGEAIETNRLKEAYPSFSEIMMTEQEEFQNGYENFLDSWSPYDRATYVIPMVVHVVHLGGDENISDEQIMDGIQQLNADFSMTNDDLGATVTAFAGITGNADIEFRLATKDPSGQCHPGITRTYSETTFDEGNSGPTYHPIVDAVEDAQGTWPQNEYMNVFICINPNGNAGYTFRPTNWFPKDRMYGSIFLRHDYMGTIGTSNSGRKHTFSHEVGHWLNLAHPWGNSNTPADPDNCGTNDGVPDTPNTIGWTSCILDGESCGSLDNVQNIMEYSYCSTMFTEGQAARMIYAITETTTADRYKLILSDNLSDTGVDAPGDLCEASFSSNQTVICAGQTVNFSDDSYHTVTDWTWTFEGGSPSTAGTENPSITYDTPGVYTVSLEVTNGDDSESVTEENYIIVLPNTGEGLPYRESFESFDAFPDNDRFVVENEDGEVTWELYTEAGYASSKSLYIENYGMDNGSKDAFVSSTIDLSSVDPDDEIIFNFKVAYNLRNSDNDEWIRFYISKDCGETWALRKNVKDDDLGETVSTSPYSPAGLADWRQVNITNILPDYYVDNFRFKIEFDNDGGNNVYVDDINLYPASMSSITEQELTTSLTVFPNPLQSTATIQLDQAASEQVTISLFNAMGQKIQDLFVGEMPAGQNQINWSTADLLKGVYIVQVQSGSTLHTIKLIKK